MSAKERWKSKSNVLFYMFSWLWMIGLAVGFFLLKDKIATIKILSVTPAPVLFLLGITMIGFLTVLAEVGVVVSLGLGMCSVCGGKGFVITPVYTWVDDEYIPCGHCNGTGWEPTTKINDLHMSHW